MLILTRRVGETLMIGDEVSVTVLGVKGNQVRLGVNAPKDIAVHREEIYQRILNERGQGQEGANFGAPTPAYPRTEHFHNHPATQGYMPSQGYDNGQGFAPRDRLTNNVERRYPRISANPRNTGLTGVPSERKGDMNHLQNQNFGANSNTGFNPNFDPFDEDYYNR